MPDRWLILPTATERGATVPAHLDREGITGYAGTRIAAEPAWAAILPGDGGYYLARVFGEADALAAVAAESDVTDLSALLGVDGWIETVLNSTLSVERDADAWRAGFDA